MTKHTGDRRKTRTRTALIAAFNDLVLNHRKKAIKVADIVEHANVGRSTFYEHYASADDIHMQALSAPFSVFADAIAGRGDAESLKWLLDHFWENRHRARTTFDGATKGQMTARLLAQMVEERLADKGNGVLPLRLIALHLAEGNLALIRGWIMGEAPCAAETLAASIIATSERALAEFFPAS